MEHATEIRLRAERRAGELLEDLGNDAAVTKLPVMEVCQATTNLVLRTSNRSAGKNWFPGNFDD